MFGLDLDALLENSASDQISVWSKKNDWYLNMCEMEVASSRSFVREDHSPLRTLSSMKTDDYEAVKMFVQNGASIYLRSPQALADVLVGSIARDLGLGVGALTPSGGQLGEIEIFISKSGVGSFLFSFLSIFLSSSYLFFPSSFIFS